MKGFWIFSCTIQCYIFAYSQILHESVSPKVWVLTRWLGAGGHASGKDWCERVPFPYSHASGSSAGHWHTGRNKGHQSLYFPSHWLPDLFISSVMWQLSHLLWLCLKNFIYPEFWLLSNCFSSSFLFHISVTLFNAVVFKRFTTIALFWSFHLLTAHIPSYFR